VLLGDETGKIRLTLWDDQAGQELAEGETLEIINAIARERYGGIEIQTGNYSAIRKSAQRVSFQETMVPVKDLQQGTVVSLQGFVTGLGEVREFQKQDGSLGQVANIYISDETGRVKVALWGDHVRLIEGLDLGYKAELIDAQVKSGWNEELEISCGWRTKITFAPPD
jgi:replication factor A1